MKLKALLLIMFVLLSMSTFAALTDDIAAYYKVDVDGSFTDEVNAFNGNITTATFKLNGKINGAYQNDGTATSKIELPVKASNFDFSNGVTIAGWFLFNSTGNGQEYDLMYFRSSSPNTPLVYVRHESSNEVTFRIRGASDSMLYADSTIVTNTWKHYAFVYNESAKTFRVYEDGSDIGGDTTSSLGNADFGNAVQDSNNYNDFLRGDAYGAIDEIGIWLRPLKPAEINTLKLHGDNGTQYPFTGPILSNLSNFSVTSSTNIFNITIVNDTFYGYFNTTNGVITTNLSTNSSSLYNITLRASGKFDHFVEGYNMSLNSSPYYYPFPPAVAAKIEYQNYKAYNGTNYTRKLTVKYTFNKCPSYNVLDTYINATYHSQIIVNCTGTADVIRYLNYTHHEEDLINITFNATFTNFLETETYSLPGDKFQWDLTNPTIEVNNISSPNGFVLGYVNISVRCYDNVSPILTYNTTFNAALINYDNETTNNATTINNSVLAQDGYNSLITYCSDFFNTTKNNNTLLINTKVLSLIDEVDNTDYDVTNASSVRVYFDDNRTYYDFKSNSKHSINFTSYDQNKLRFEIIYGDGRVITRYVDVRLLDDNIRVCANKDDVTHYEQLIVSASATKTATLENIFSNCVVAADYTRFAYQDALVLKAYTIASLYSLYTTQSGAQVLLASVDGSISSYINIDTLELNLDEVNIDIFGDGLAFQKSGTSQIKIYYNNLQGDNEELSLLIKRMDTNTNVFSKSSFLDPNEFTLYFDYSTLNNISNNTIFQIVLTKTNALGTAEQIKKYFNVAGQTGILNSFVAVFLSMGLLILGLTFTIGRTAFSWFGMIISIASLGILAFGVWTWYLTLAMAINIIVLVYIFFNLVVQNYPEVS